MGRRKLIQDAELLAAARKIFIGKGFAAPTREIARRAGVSEAVLYQRYPTKADLFFAAMVPPAMNVEQLFAVPSDRSAAPAHLEEIALRLLQYFREVLPVLMSLMTHPSFDFEKFASRHSGSPFERIRSGLTGFLMAQRRRGTIATRDPGAVALTLFASLHSLALMERLGVHGGRFDDSLVRAMVRALWAGLAPRRGQ
ncbi:MAG: TetR/AcrR family transcriptional regulator [Planctomycetes bacterium]|nr:TetR/AcrR family transcriptional regulator [Planctomycetota bacterium]